MAKDDRQIDPFVRGVGRPATSAFALEGYTTLESLAGASRSQLLALHGVGPEAIRILQEALESRGLPPLTISNPFLVNVN